MDSPRLMPLLLVLAWGCSSEAGAVRPDPSTTPGAALEPYPGQAGWLREEPANAMRKAQFRLPAAPGAGDASLVVYSFPSAAGSVEANFERWATQFEQADGRSSMDVARRATAERDGLTLHTFELGGRYVAETRPGSGERLDEADWRMLAAIVEGRGDPAYVKLVGPAATVERWEPSYRAFLAQVDPDRAP